VFEQAARFAIGESVLFSRIPDYSKDFVLIVTRKNRSETAVFDGRPDASYRAAKVPRRMMKEIIAAVNTNVDKFMSEHHTHGPLIGSDENHFLLYRRNVLQYVDENIRWNVDVAPYKIGKIITDTYLRTAFVDYGVFCTLDALYQALVGSFVPFKCAFCDTQEKMPRCGRCRQVRYCSRECQTLDWPQHKTSCKMHAELASNVADVIDGAEEGNFAMVVNRDAIRALSGFFEYLKL
jgi:hypothetical protein